MEVGLNMGLGGALVMRFLAFVQLLAASRCSPAVMMSQGGGGD